jgi:hypothetical protein
MAAYGVGALPTTAIVDPKGRIAYWHRGFIANRRLLRAFEIAESRLD